MKPPTENKLNIREAFIRLTQRNVVRQFFFYVLVGFGATAADWGSFYFFNSIGKVDYKIAVILSCCMGAATNYIFNKRFTFKDKTDQYATQLTLFAGVTLTSLLFSSALMYIQVEYAAIVPMLARIITSGILTPVNFSMHKLLTYNRKLYPETEKNDPPLWIYLGLIILIAFIWGTMISEGQIWGDDFALYILHAKNIAEGLPYIDTGYIYNPNTGISPPAYPPGFPLLLSGVYAVWGMNFIAFKLEQVVFFSISALLMVFYFRRRLQWEYLLALLGLLGLSNVYFDQREHIVSDLPFLMLLFAALLAMQRGREDMKGASLLKKIAIGAGWGALIFACVHTRTIGISILLALFCYEIIKTRRLSAAALTAAVVFAALHFALRLIIPSTSGYKGQFIFTAGHLLDNAIYIVKNFGVFFANGHSKLIAALMFFTTVPLFVIGIRRRFKIEGLALHDVFFVVYFVPLLPFLAIPARYLNPIYPIYMYYVLVGLSTLKDISPNRYFKFAAPVLLAAWFASLALFYTGGNLKENKFTPFSPQSNEMFAFITDNTDKKDVIIFVKPRAMALFTGRKSSNLHAVKNDAEGFEYFKKVGATYLVQMDWPSAATPAINGLIERNNQAVQKVFDNKTFQIYKISVPQ